MNLDKLKEPFAECDIEWRLAQCGETNGKLWGLCLAYIQARAVMDRLDEVCGSENWKVKYDVTASGTICTLAIKVGSEWIEKQDGAEATDIEAFKGGISGALKRAGSVWGISRYLYRLESGFIQVVDKGTQGALYGKTKEGKTFYWLPPALPSWALPPVPTKQPAPQGTITAPASITEPEPPKPQDRQAEPKPMARVELIKTIMETARQLRLSDRELGDWATEEFKKPTKNLSPTELEQFLGILQGEVGRMGDVK